MELAGLAQELGAALKKQSLMFACAESCTGGLIANSITNIAGSSDYFLGGYVSYSYESKMEWLHVKEETLNRFGAVSSETVFEMVQGVITSTSSFCSPNNLICTAVSGIAGPGGGTVEKPVGTVWIGWSFLGDIQTKQYLFQGDRLSIKEKSAEQAMLGALNFLLER